MKMFITLVFYEEKRGNTPEFETRKKKMCLFFDGGGENLH